VTNRAVTPLLLIACIFIVLVVFTIFAIHYGNVARRNVAEFRRVRVFSAVLSGFILGIAGVYLQGCMRNPLVDHYVLGIGSGALFATYLSVILIGYSYGYVQLSAVLGGLAALAVTIAVAELIGGSDVAYVIAGMGVNALFSGLSVFLSYLVASKYMYAIHLLVGSFAISLPRNQPYLLLAFAVLLATYPILAKPLNAIILGDQYATQLGYSPRIHRRIAVVVAGISSSIVVSIHGLIGFIGLISPHIARFALKTADHRFTVIASGLIGALLLSATDSFVYMVLARYVGEIPSGALVSVFGTPFFVLLVIKRFKR